MSENKNAKLPVYNVKGTLVWMQLLRVQSVNERNGTAVVWFQVSPGNPKRAEICTSGLSIDRTRMLVTVHMLTPDWAIIRLPRKTVSEEVWLYRN